LAVRRPRYPERARANTGQNANGKGLLMSASDKIKNKVDDLGGKAKEGIGKASGDKSTENEGRLDQAKASLKDAGEKVKDAFKK
jgi:uncharacterized protein YjbJ (UPF0337 family)